MISVVATNDDLITNLLAFILDCNGRPEETIRVCWKVREDDSRWIFAADMERTASSCPPIFPIKKSKTNKFSNLITILKLNFELILPWYLNISIL